VKYRQEGFAITETQDRFAVACADCPRCGKENVLGRVSSERTGFNSTCEQAITCKHCDLVFSLPEYDLQIRRQTREKLDREYSLAALVWVG
jgi:transposase-like protein